FKCNYKGKEYYLASIKASECNNKLAEDCKNVIMILMDVDDVNKRLVSYNNNLDKNKVMCNDETKKKCLDNKLLPESELKKLCDRDFDQCKQPRFFYNDFIMTSTENPNKYL